MSRLFLVIDGYNLMYAAGLGANRRVAGALERSRNRLIREISAQLDPQIAADAVFVFDAPELPPFLEQPSRGAVSGGPEIRFSQSGRDADAEIELILASHSSPKQILVISSDHRLSKAAARRKAKCLDSEAFLAALEAPDHPWNRGKNRRRPPPKSEPRLRAEVPPEPGSLQDPAEYEREFLQIDVSEIARSLRKKQK